MRRASAFALGIALLLASAAWAQLPGLPGAEPAAAEAPAEAPPSEPPAAEVLEVSDIFGRAADTEREVRTLESIAVPAPEITAIVEVFPQAGKRLDERTAGAKERVRAVPHVRALRDLKAVWLSEQQQFDLWNQSLTDRVRALDDALKRLDEIAALWQSTREEFAGSELPAAVQERIEATLSSLVAPRQAIADRRDALLAVQADISEDLDKIGEILGLAEATENKLRSGILGTDAPPIWTAIARGRVSDLVMQRELEALRSNLATVRSYASGRLDRVVLHLVVLLAAAICFRVLDRVASRWPADDSSVRASATVLTRPISGALLVGFSLVRVIYPAAPFFFYDLIGLLALVPLVRLLPPLLPETEHRFVYAFVVFYVVDVVRELIAPLVTLERLLFIVEMASVAVVLWFAVRPVRARYLSQNTRLLPFTGIAIRLAMLMFGVAAGANALGSTAFALALGDGMLLSVFAALVLYGVYRLVDGVIVVMLRSEFASRLNMVRVHRALVTRTILQVFRIALTLAWVYVTSDALGIRDWLVSFVLRALSAEFSVGDLSISPGGGVTFLLVFLVALYVSRLLRFTLEQDVLPRMRLPRGVPYAITATLHYAILFVALMAALTAAGIDLSKFSLLAGALGVGVGFGLQNIVNNFISGLILLFERPIQTNDVVEVGTLLGKVRRIGIRSSTVRTLDGAEVIVPNANLISDQVVNWTLSDRQRRIDITVGVKYGTDPEQVLALLQQVAEDDDRVLDQPTPDALFVGFGDSSLDFLLRVWTPGYDEWIHIRSDINVAVNRALAEAGIEIPFPQRDLHLRSVSEDAVVGFRSSEDES